MAFSPRRLARRVALLLAITLTLALALEGAVRLTGRADFARLHPEPGAAIQRLGEVLFQPDGELVYTLANDVVVRDPARDLEYRTNRCACRTHGDQGDLAVPKPSGVLRVLCLGDSCTFGLRVPGDVTYAAVLERLLRETAPGSEVWNLGVPGYTSAHGVRLLERAARFEPDVVVLAFGYNDSFLSQVSAAADLQCLDEGRWRWSLRELVAHSALIRALMHAVGSHPRFESVAPDGDWQVRVPQEGYEANMRTLVTRARALGAQPILVDLDIPNTFCAEPLRRLARELEAPLVSVRDLPDAQLRNGHFVPSPELAAGSLQIRLAEAKSPPFVVALATDRRKLKPLAMPMEKDANGGWKIDAKGVPPGVELAVAAAEPKDMRALVRLANYSFFAPIPPLDGERGWLLPLESMSTSPYGE